MDKNRISYKSLSLMLRKCIKFQLGFIINILVLFQMKYLLLFLALITLSTAFLYRSSQFKKKGIDVEDGILDKIYAQPLNATTTCATVNFNVAPYYYNGVVRTGYLNVNKGNSVLSFMFYGRQNTAEAEITKYPFLIWLNGGPGSSSQFGNLFELGPYRIVTSNMKPYDIVKNNNSWTKEYNVVFVDQPVGTGLGYADQTVKDVYCTNMTCVADDFYYALKELLLTPAGCLNQLKFKPDHPFFVFGESYGGKYAPAIGEKILREAQDNNATITGLKGVAIGDGFTNPSAILSQMGEYAYNLGLLDYQERSVIEQVILNGTFQERRKYWKDLHNTFEIALELIVEWAGGVNVYDITKYREYPDLIIDEYLGNNEVQTLFALRKDIKFGGQAANVYEAMYEDFMKPYFHLVEDVLRRNCKVMVYNGQNDLIVQTPGTFKWAERIHYDKAEEFRNTLFSVWKADGKTAGYRKQVGLYELRTVNNAGHLVPMDQGPAALQLVKDFVSPTTEESVKILTN